MTKECWIDVKSFIQKVKNNNAYVVPVIFYEKPKIFNKQKQKEIIDTILKQISVKTVEIENKIKNVNCEVVTVSRIIPKYKTKQKQTRSGRSVKIAKRNVEIDFPIGLFVILPKSVSFEVVSFVYKLSEVKM